MSGELAGRVVAFVFAGDARDREIAVACAEAGADIALGTAAKADEFAVASIANEVWAIGREHFVRIMDATDPTAVASFADEVWDRLRRCDGLVLAVPPAEVDELDQVSHEAFVAGLDRAVVAPFLVAQAFGRLLARSGEGEMILLGPDGGQDVISEIAREGLRGFAHAAYRAWPELVVRTTSVGVTGELIVGWISSKWQPDRSRSRRPRQPAS
jgi:NAD(P)-dependent dehydrogenase (short-subunit alcohol dehydrogenase family)